MRNPVFLLIVCGRVANVFFYTVDFHDSWNISSDMIKPTYVSAGHETDLSLLTSCHWATRPLSSDYTCKHAIVKWWADARNK